MQPRQRSKWRGGGRPTRARRAPEPHQVDAAAGRVRLVAPQRVGRAGRQAEAAVDAGIEQLAGRDLSHRTPPPPAARAAATLGSDPVVARRRGGGRGRAADDARRAGRAQVVDRGRHVGREARGGRAGRRRPRGARPRAPRRPRRSRRRPASAASSASSAAAGLSKRTSMCPGGQAYSTQAGASGSSTSGSAGSATTVQVAAGSGCRRTHTRTISPRRPARADGQPAAGRSRRRS